MQSWQVCFIAFHRCHMDDHLLHTRVLPAKTRSPTNVGLPWYACEISHFQFFKMRTDARVRIASIVALIFSALASAEKLPTRRLERAVEERQACYDDDILLSFQYWSNDSVPYCSSLLSLHDHTDYAVPVTSTTYVLLSALRNLQLNHQL